MTPPKVSILMPVRNQARFLGEAIDSILVQRFGDYELVVVDNASEDNTPALLSRYAERELRLRWTRNSTNIGMVPNWNECLKQARGEYIKYLAGDDKLSNPEALGTLVAVLDDNPGAVLAASSRYILQENSRQVKTCNDLAHTGLYRGRTIILRCLRETHNLIGEPSAALFRRMPARRGFNPAYQQLVDLEMWFHLLEHGDLAYCAKPLCVFRQHDEQASVIHEQTRLGEREYVQLISEWLPKDWVHRQSDRDLIFHQTRYCRKRRNLGPETADLAHRLFTELGGAWYGLCWLRYKLRRLFQPWGTAWKK